MNREDLNWTLEFSPMVKEATVNKAITHWNKLGWTTLEPICYPMKDGYWQVAFDGSFTYEQIKSLVTDIPRGFYRVGRI